ncbi:hypothetical protein [Sodalis sp. (in: enterobacteria)]
MVWQKCSGIRRSYLVDHYTMNYDGWRMPLFSYLLQELHYE